MAIFGHLSLHEYEVCFFNLSFFKLEAQESVGGGIFGKEDYSACSAIQPMNNKDFFIEVCSQLFVQGDAGRFASGMGRGGDFSRI